MKTGSVIFVVGRATAHDTVLIKFGLDRPVTRIMFEVGYKADKLYLVFFLNDRMVYAAINVRAPLAQLYGIRLAFRKWRLLHAV